MTALAGLEELFEDLAAGRCTVEAARKRHGLLCRGLAGREVRFDWDRPSRKGIGEVVYSPGKEFGHLEGIRDEALRRRANVAFSRLEGEVARRLGGTIPEWSYEPRSRLGTLVCVPPETRGRVAVVAAGTTDIPAAEEAAGIAGFSGCGVDRFYDVGVSGIHRLFEVLPSLREADVAVVAAGMEGALPSVVAGLVPGLVIGLPTSVGYGIAEGGRTALRAMLASCCPGLVVVNIDNGVGAGLSAALVARGRGCGGATGPSGHPTPGSFGCGGRTSEDPETGGIRGPLPPG